jgi:predicted GIY-YIG superfamily endonuclease
MSGAGYLYIITNQAWQGFVKVGVTLDLKKRLQQYQTSSPFRDYKLVYSIQHPKYLEAEKQIKETMKPFAKSIKNEWFEVDLHMAKPRLDEQLELYENNKKGIDLF